MKLIDMAIPKKTKAELKKMDQPVYEGEGNRYPYGLQLRFEKEEIDKISALKNVEAGAKVNITAVGKVTEVRVTDSEKGNNRHSVEIQIHSVDIPDTANFKDAFKEAIKK